MNCDYSVSVSIVSIGRSRADLQRTSLIRSLSFPVIGTSDSSSPIFIDEIDSVFSSGYAGDLVSQFVPLSELNKFLGVSV